MRAPSPRPNAANAQRLLSLVILIFIALSTNGSWAQTNYPERPIQVVSGWRSYQTYPR